MKMHEGVEGVQQKREVSGEEMTDKITEIRNLDIAVRGEAWEAFFDEYENQNLNEMCEEILWKARLHRSTDRAETQIRELSDF